MKDPDLCFLAVNTPTLLAPLPRINTGRVHQVRKDENTRQRPLRPVNGLTAFGSKTHQVKNISEHR